MNSYLFFGITFLCCFGVGFIVFYNNTITSSNPTTTVNMFSQETLFKNNYDERSNSYNLFHQNHLALNLYNIPLANAQQKEGNKINNNEINENNNDKYVILLFDRGYKSTFTKAKPILDKQDFKVSIFVACSRTESSKGMTWDQLRQLQDEGHDIQSHGSEHIKLVDIKSYEQIETIVKEGKECLQKQGFNPTIFQAPL